MRATGLGMGYGWGTVNPARNASGLETTISGVNYLGKRGDGHLRQSGWSESGLTLWPLYRYSH